MQQIIIKIMSGFGWFSIGEDAQDNDDDYMDGGTRILVRMCVQTYPPMFDAQVQIQRVVTKSFATFDGLTYVCDNEFAHEDPPSKNDIKHSDTSRSETVMDALFTKVATLFYEGCFFNVFNNVVVIEFEHNAWCIKKNSWMNFFHYLKKNYRQKQQNANHKL